MLKRHALQTLGLSERATEDEIRAAWRKKARMFHPDSPYGDVNAFQSAKAAFETLLPTPEQTLKRRVRVPASSRRAS